MDEINFKLLDDEYQMRVKALRDQAEQELKKTLAQKRYSLWVSKKERLKDQAQDTEIFWSKKTPEIDRQSKIFEQEIFEDYEGSRAEAHKQLYAHLKQEKSKTDASGELKRDWKQSSKEGHDQALEDAIEAEKQKRLNQLNQNFNDHSKGGGRGDR